MRKLKNTIPVDETSLTVCPCGTGRKHLRLDHAEFGGQSDPLAPGQSPDKLVAA